jgi:hypothetical protein
MKILTGGTCDVQNCACRASKPIKKDVYHVWLQKKRDTEWKLAGLARIDGDKEAEKYHTGRATAL